ncbi:phosphoribosylaminoimidazole-succinocarboxamide synthase [Clostridia bacterium]|nr:phosphoribosylaminoimidazole-succinocarboxamide synthase [Clostridia bacterium]
MSDALISGKVREVYESADGLIIVTTDRISAYDVVLDTPIPHKGVVLNRLSLFWFDYTKDIVKNHIISDNTDHFPERFRSKYYERRTVLVKPLRMLPFEFIVRGYIFGNMWEAYKEGKPFCGEVFPQGLLQAQKLPTPILTPSTKAAEGHDVYVTFDYVTKELGAELAQTLQKMCIKLYTKCATYAYQKGIIIADTKFEFGIDKQNNLVLADEIFTPDSSRFWNLADYKTGTSPVSFDKQYVRDWLTKNNAAGVTPPPRLPDDVVHNTSLLYLKCFERLTT